jgi:hypothetical protein
MSTTCTQPRETLIDCWPFPTQENPLTPWTPQQTKEYRDSLDEESPL